MADLGPGPPAGFDLDAYEEPVEVGRGGFATVYRARQPSFERDVAIKVLTAVPDERALTRFRRECQAIGALSGHPNIVTVYEIGVTATGHPFIVMEYLPSGLAQGPGRFGAERWPAVVDVGVRLAGALASAHRAQVLHRDVKPENVLLSRFGEPKLADFGIARIGGVIETRSGSVTASVLHAPPEVLGGTDASTASDLYSLASTLHQLLRGTAPFAQPGDESLLPLVARIATEPAPDLRPLGVPDPLCAVLEQALGKDPSARQAGVEAFGRDLQALQRDAGLPETPLRISGAPRPGGPTQAPGSRTGGPPATPGAPSAGPGGETRSFWVAPPPTPTPAPAPGPTPAPAGGTAPAAPEPEPAVAAPSRSVRARRLPWLVGAAVALALVVAGVAALSGRDGGSAVAVPSVLRLAEGEARDRLEEAGLEVSVEEVPAGADRETVVGQDPSAGAEAGEGDRVTLEVSTGPRRFPMPDVVGQRRTTALRELRDLGLRVVVEEPYPGPPPRGDVVATDPEPGERVRAGADVTLFWSDGTG